MDLPRELRGRSLSRRELLRYFGMLGAGAVVSKPAAAWASGPGPAALIDHARKTKAAGSDLGAIDHIVFLMMENRSYDHYFGAYPRGRGFNDHPKHSLGVFAQDYPGGSALFPKNTLLPFHLDAGAGLECTDDLTHEWGPMHLCWNEGAMDSWVKVHTSSKYEGAHGAMTMGYYERGDLPFYWALADAFTLCDHYHCSILGPTHPNRLMANSGTIDPEGKAGGPVTDTNFTPDLVWNCRWPTMQEVLQDAGVSWKVYSPSNQGVGGKYAALKDYLTWDAALYNPIVNPEVMTVSDHVLPYFSAFRNPLSPLYEKAFRQTFPNDFVADVNSGSLPSVSWLIPPLGFDEHPSSAPANGMYFTSLVLDALIANPAVWSKTALFLMHDENDGWFDHVPPPTAPPGTPGEYLTAKPPLLGDPSPGTLGITGPLGLGVRVPSLVISPFSRGGHVASELFDHTSQLKLVSERFGVEVPNVSKWRRATVGDLTSTLFRRHADTEVPALPTTTVDLPSGGACAALDQYAEIGGAHPSIPTKQTMPTQGGGSTPASRYFAMSDEERAIPGDHRTAIEVGGPHTITAKSRHNRLATRR
ncbi:MAG TPA: alkaline phosphatase family protein [Solirubrobacteraceae bacterium]|nr:alkaline phosphatase family protein [Solirubrobacteraceae bacterium]